MKWKAPSDRVQMIIAAPVVFPIVALALPIFGIMAGLFWLTDRLCPHRTWHDWYAWRPVNAYCEPFDLKRVWVWLEPVERCGSCSNGWTYRAHQHGAGNGEKHGG